MALEVVDQIVAQGRSTFPTKEWRLATADSKGSGVALGLAVLLYYPKDQAYLHSDDREASLQPGFRGDPLTAGVQHAECGNPEQFERLNFIDDYEGCVLDVRDAEAH